MTEITHAAADPNVLGTLGINWKLFIAQLVNVAIVLFLLRLWVFKPLVRMLETRRKKIEDGVKHAEEADKRLTGAKETEASMVARANAEAHKTLEAARAAGEEERKALVGKSAQDIDRQVADAKEKIVTEREQAKEAVRREMAGLVLAATQKVTSGDVDAATHTREIERAIAELEAAT